MRIEGIDHVHIEVADRAAATAWYSDVLGLVPEPSLARWADDPGGPLILGVPGVGPALSLFERAPRQTRRDSTVAFRLRAQAFLRFLDSLSTRTLRTKQGARLTRDHIVDHGLSWSIYFVDLDENPLELTTYDYTCVARALDAPRPKG
ncbi:MAG: hypothetical protein AAF748_02470 [Pseudomonadota bacterium]